MPFRVAISTAPDPQGSGWFNTLTLPYTTASCAAGNAGRDSSRYRYHGNSRKCELTLDYECNWVELTRGVYEITWKCGELEPYFFPSAGG